jgi:hypothetical protein
MNENNIDPNNKCGYESIWVALKCKKSSMIDKYNLTDMKNVYTLLRYGNNQYPPLFEEKNVKTFLEICPAKTKKLCEEFKSEILDMGHGSVWKCYFMLVSIYFNIGIILMDENKEKLENESALLNYILNSLELNPEETIRLHLTPNHVEYMPEDNELEIFENLTKKSNIDKLIYDEIIAQNEFNTAIDCNPNIDDEFESILDELGFYIK